MSVVPERGRPKTNTGRRVFNPAPVLRATKGCPNPRSKPSTKRSCSSGAYLASAPGQFEGQGIGLAHTVGGTRIVALTVEDVSECEQQSSTGP